MNEESEGGRKDGRRHLIPAHILYPGAVVLLLLAGMGGTAAVFLASRSDGGVSVVDDYYRKAAEWDVRLGLERRSDELGWRLVSSVESRGSGLSVRFGILDVDDRPLTGVTGTVSIRRPDAPIEDRVVHVGAVQDTVGSVLEVLLPRPGVWYFDFDLSRGEDRFVKTLRRDFAG
jgi:nitrogen fixation protein FixH